MHGTCSTTILRTVVRLIHAPLLLLAICASNVCALETPAADAALQESPEQELIRENGMLRQRLQTLEATPAISRQDLTEKSFQRLRDIARDTRAQRQSMAEFEEYVTWMSTSVSGYTRYIETGSMLAGVARVLPIPYAGQASLFTRFAAQGLLSLNATSTAISRYLATSQQFVTRVEVLERSAVAPAEVSALCRFADEQLMRDVLEIQQKLASTSEFSTSTLSFLETLNHYVESGDQCWNKAKSLLTRNESVGNDKGFLAKSIQSLRDRNARFTTRMKNFNDTARGQIPRIKTLAAYDELLHDLDTKLAVTRQQPQPAGVHIP